MASPDERPRASARARLTNRDLARIAVFAALLSAFSFVRIPVGPVPITLQTLAVMLAGTVLGPRCGALSVLTVLVLAFAGLPLLGGNGGVAAFVGPTSGYLYGFVLGAAAAGLIARGRGAGRPSPARTALACLVGGVIVPYAVGIPFTAAVLGQGLLPTALASAVFLPGDALKVVLATMVDTVLARAYPAAFEAVTARRGTGSAPSDADA